MIFLGVLQARMSSTRLPGKVLRPILGRPMLALQIERLLRSKRMERLVVATSTAVDDMAVADLCAAIGVDCHRGPLDDVLARCLEAAAPFAPRHVIRLTGDCPLADPDLIDRIATIHLEGDNDYTSNTLAPTWPDGLDVETVRFACLVEAGAEAGLPSEREHVTSFVKTRPERFRLENVVRTDDLSDLRWTVDEPEDFELVKTIYEKLYPDNPTFGTDEILALLEARPKLKTCNTHHLRDAGYLKSLAEDRRHAGN